MAFFTYTQGGGTFYIYGWDRLASLLSVSDFWFIQGRKGNFICRLHDVYFLIPSIVLLIVITAWHGTLSIRGTIQQRPGILLLIARTAHRFDRLVGGAGLLDIYSFSFMS